MTSTNDDCAIDYQTHWNKAYEKNPTEKLGWYEEKSEQTLNLISKTNLPKDATILNVGNGSSTLIDDLISQDYTNIIASDISSKALASARERLGSNAEKVQFIEDDLTKSTKLNSLSVDLWNDRAVLHFFLTKAEINAYFNLLKKVLKPNGYVIIATFAIEGAEKCCGLPLQRYNAEMIQERLGVGFKLVEAFDYTFVNPYGGERPYVYTLFQKI